LFTARAKFEGLEGECSVELGLKIVAINQFPEFLFRASNMHSESIALDELGYFPGGRRHEQGFSATQVFEKFSRLLIFLVV
jgi:hypothetical protein